MNKVFYLFLLIPLIMASNTSHGQFLENDKDLLAANNIQSLTIVELFADSTCLHQVMEYDSQGNEIKYDLLRLGHYYRSVYDTSRRKVQELKVDKSDETQVDSTFFEYDEHGSVIKETSVYFYGEERSEFSQFFRYEYDSLGNPLKQCQLLEEEDGTWQEILLNEYVYNARNQLEKVLQYIDGEVAAMEFYQYNEDSLLIRRDVDDPTWFERTNMMKIKERPDISEQYTTYAYNDKQQVIEVYQYFSDPCLTMDNYYAYRYTYLPNGLIAEIEVWEERKEMVSKVRFDYQKFEAD